MKYSDLVRTGAAAVLAVALAALPAAAKNGAGNTKVKPVKVASAKPASAGPKAKAPKGPKAQAPKAAKAQAPKGSAQMAKASGPSTTKSASKTKGSTRNVDRSGDGTPAASLQDFADNTPTPGTVPQSKAQEKLANNLKLRQRMRMRLGRDPMAAASGFKNLGQFVAAVNVSNNQGIDFNLLKGLMVNRGMSLGQAIQQAKAIEARRATSLANAALVQANDEITATSLVSVTSGKTKTKGD